MKHIKILTLSWNFALSIKYLEVIIRCLEPKLFDEKVDVLLDFYRIKLFYLIT